MNNRLTKIYFDPYLFFSLFTLSVFGLFFLYSASNADISIVLKQSVYIILGFVLMILVSQADPDLFRRTSLMFMILSLLLLGITFLFGPEINGAQRWVRIGSFSFQSSELLKLALPIFLANFLFDKRLPIQSREIVITLVIICISFLLVARQPDLGTAVIVALSGLFVLFLSGLSWSFIGGAFITLIICSPLIWNVLLEPFQQQRVATFFNPGSDPFGAGWNIIQSKIAIGSGGIFGKGFGEGSQTQLNFLPETKTDFIFSVIGEEFGFLGVMLLLCLYFFILTRCLYLALNARDRFCRLVIGGLTLTFAANLIINLCMVVGLLPVVGMPLPFISKGGSSLISLFFAFGIITSMGTHKKFLPQ
ncbi:rod shape-determining protein RodA [Gammaproteobacteria bacterium]|mgnify:FL=1|jgi:rod shape determining protein RodA|nr:rod shape-determining protein RodA [Gammaproteobacteria bacterium]|tara:strand:+ start:3966 stop:5054 length:1089 start_codon:yes stop_codon:yes gene_type:complete